MLNLKIRHYNCVPSFLGVRSQFSEIYSILLWGSSFERLRVLSQVFLIDFLPQFWKFAYQMDLINRYHSGMEAFLHNFEIKQFFFFKNRRHSFHLRNLFCLSSVDTYHLVILIATYYLSR